jgi:hypothetical protein
MISRGLIFVLLILSAAGATASEVLDRVVATVNGHVILLSDWQDEIRFGCFSSGKKLAEATREEKQAALERLIDQELLREQMRDTDAQAVSPQEVEDQLKSLKEDYTRSHAGEDFASALSKYGLSESYLRERVAAELRQLKFIDSRFRPSVQVSTAEVQAYYEEQLVPKLPPSDPVNLNEVTPKIREILAQKKIDEMLDAWMETLRSQAQIKTFPIGSDSAPQSKQATQ